MENRDLYKEFGDPVVGYACPKCDAIPMDDDYLIDADNYPKRYNYSNTANAFGDNISWKELHCCPDCSTMFWFVNGN